MNTITLRRAESEPGADAPPLVPQLLRHTSAPLPRESVDFDAVMSAAFEGRVAPVVLALRKGLPINFSDAFNRTLLYAASLCGHLSLLRTLLACGASDNVHTRRCFVNALNEDVRRLLLPMYEAEELRDMLDVPEPSARYVVPRHLDVKVAEVPTPKEENTLELSLKRVAEALQLSEESAEKLRQQTEEGKAIDWVGSFAGGQLMRRDEYDQIDWGSWPVRYAQWLLEVEDRRRRFGEWEWNRTRRAPTSSQRRRLLNAPHLRMMRKKARAVNTSVDPPKVSAPRENATKFSRTRRWREPNQAGVLLSTSTPKPRLYHHVEVKQPKIGTMSMDRLMEHYSGHVQQRKKREEDMWNSREMPRSKLSWKDSYMRSRSFQRKKKRTQNARQKNRDFKMAASGDLK